MPQAAAASLEADPPAGRYLLLGATGLIGSHALAALAGRAEVEVLALGGRRLPPALAANVRTGRIDLRSPDELASAVAGVDYVLAFAGRVQSAPVLASDPVAPVLENLELTARVLEAARRERVRRVVWLSSTTGYPAREGELEEDAFFDGEPPDPWFLVGTAARYLEMLARGIAERTGSATGFVALRPSLVYGEGDDFSLETGHFLPALVRRVVERHRPIELWGDGSEARDLIHAADVARAAVLALSLPKTTAEGFEAFNVAAGSSHRVRDVLRLLLEFDGFRDAEVVFRSDRPRAALARRFSGRRARERLGFEPRVGLEAGLRRTLDWFRRHRERARGVRPAA